MEEYTSVMGYLSSKLVEDKEFLNTIFSGDKETIREFMLIELKKYFNQYLDRV